jgi:hypothetical protein
MSNLYPNYYFVRRIIFKILLVISSGIILILANVSCKKKEPAIQFPLGTFPDTIVSLSDINTPYDDYNSTLLQTGGTLPIIFSSNRGSQGGQFDLVAGNISYMFDKVSGEFGIGSEMSSDPFLYALVARANTVGNDFGPTRLFSSTDGYEYLILSSLNTSGNLDLFYLKYLPRLGSNVPVFPVPVPVKLLNTSSNDAYISFDNNRLTAYFTSDRGGNYDIYSLSKPASSNLDAWFNSDFANSTKVDSINTTADDKCPFIHNNIMIFSSNRPGGIGGYDLYYSIFKGGKWGTPVNLGPEINTSSDEFRPVIGSQSDFTNVFIIFSSNRPGGKGGFDLYFMGYELPG